MFVKLKRMKEFYCAKINNDLGFLERARCGASVEEGEEGDIFGEDACSGLSHFVNRIDQRAEELVQRPNDSREIPEDFLDFVNSNEKKEENEFTFDLSLKSFAKEKKKKVKQKQKGFLRLGTMESANSPIQKTRSGLEFFPSQKPQKKKAFKSTQLEYIEAPDFFDVASKMRRMDTPRSRQRTLSKVSLASKSKSPDFIGVGDFKSGPRRPKRPVKEYKDFQNIFEETGWPRVNPKRHTMVERTKPDPLESLWVRRSTQLDRKQKINPNSVDMLFVEEEKGTGLLPEFDNRPSVAKRRVKSTVQTSVDFLF